jgi:7,8-dihydro-6-hydroxymethylpterin dimethyltransferase
MECTTCGPATGGPGRPDRPHTFFSHEKTPCPTCGAELLGRVVLRDGAVFRLAFCKDHGQSEARVADDADAYVAAFVARGELAEGEEERVFKQTTSTCPRCLALVDADVVIKKGKVYLHKRCAKCGPSQALVSEDAAHYTGAYAFARAGTEPHAFRTPVAEGCPTDCGTCSDHEQHTCLPIIEVTDHCNLECPICIVNNQYANHLHREALAQMLDRLIAAEGQCESVALSGGEPTSHPQILDLVDEASRPEIGRVVIITNGIRLGKDRRFAEALKQRGAYVGLQLDGFTAEAHTKIRGRDLCQEKADALAALKELEIPTQLIFVATRGVNEDQMGQAVDLLLREDHILSLNFQPAAYTGKGGGAYAHDPLDRLTIPGVIRAAAAQSGGRLAADDFYPLPCSHPLCTSLTYLLRLDDGSFVPFPRFIDFTRYTTLLRSSATLASSAEIHEAMEDVIHEVFAYQDTIPRGPEILRALRRTLDVLFPPRPLDVKESVRLGERQVKSIFIHHYMDRDDFDLERLRKCCHHYPQIDGRIMPACGFNMFHRGAAQGEGTPLPSWGKQPWTNDPHAGTPYLLAGGDPPAAGKTRLPIVG